MGLWHNKRQHLWYRRYKKTKYQLESQFIMMVNLHKLCLLFENTTFGLKLSTTTVRFTGSDLCYMIVLLGLDGNSELLCFIPVLHQCAQNLCGLTGHKVQPRERYRSRSQLNHSCLIFPYGHSTTHNWLSDLQCTHETCSYVA